MSNSRESGDGVTLEHMRRFSTSVIEPTGNSNIHRRYAIEAAAWVWHPDCAVDEPAVLQFTNTFSLDEPTTIRLHLSADQRYELLFDGRYVGMGPDRCDLDHWSFASYEIDLAAGTHRFDVLAWWIGADAPTAQVSRRGGFICAAEGLEAQLNTGTGSWQVQRRAGWSFVHKDMQAYHAIGAAQTIDGLAWHEPAKAPLQPSVVATPIKTNDYGIVADQWHLHPSPLPDLLRRPIRPGRIRAVWVGDGDIVHTESTCHEQVQAWNQLITQGQSINVPARTVTRILWDLENYHCGFANATLSGGNGSALTFEWAESLYSLDKQGQRSPHKNHRDEIEGKAFFGFGDTFLNDGGEHRDYRSCWWRSGRYVCLTVRTGDEPLRLENVGILETRYLWQPTATWHCNDDELAPVADLAVRGLQMCMHETYMDCPYYEQMMYVGDTRLQMLVGYICSPDDRLTRRGIELFDWSRSKMGLVAERYPSTPLQISATFSLIWISMVKDYAWWRHDPNWVRQRLVGVRCLLEQFRPMLNESGLLGSMPGWSFVDWTPEWTNGCPPVGPDGVSAIYNLLLIHALRDAVALEEAYGEPALARRWQDTADQLSKQVVEIFWHEPSGCLADDARHQHFSEHAQCLALLTRTLVGDKADAALARLLNGEGLAHTTIYFSFYLLETLYRFGQGDRMMQQFAFWKRLVQQGLRTPVELPEPTRSDCHAWGAHPLFHFHASLAGIRPAAPGFSQVRIAPVAGTGLRRIESRIPHPAGEVRASLRIDPHTNHCQGEVVTPPGISGTFAWADQSVDLMAGQPTPISIRPRDAKADTQSR
ncbi:alpha-L-rhamnosidase C-terminal domain-containing protein [Phycisphaerales bacterium AB-hyl4]|uniref:Alpha-L-rhamnosidase C-terminal domain-containing protein n=1 Tax=Natronomicrosphaera hydrolytica TaxID=3242702 RepID=A0ABV4UAS0_9BACT